MASLRNRSSEIQRNIQDCEKNLERRSNELNNFHGDVETAVDEMRQLISEIDSIPESSNDHDTIVQQQEQLNVS